MPHVENVDKFVIVVDSVKNLEWATGDLANKTSRPSTINRANFWKRLKNSNMGNNAVSHTNGGLVVILSDEPNKPFQIG